MTQTSLADHHNTYIGHLSLRTRHFVKGHGTNGHW